MNNTFFTSDTHFGHENILYLQHRPYKTIDEMDNQLIQKWNNKVTPDDTIYIVGDLIYKNIKPAEFYLKSLNGKKHLILGNHDTSWYKEDYSKYFESVSEIKTIILNEKNIVICHYPMMEWNGSRTHKAEHIFGHIHSRLKFPFIDLIRQNKFMFNAGSDINNYEPVTYEELVKNNAEFYGRA